ncbi:HAD family hydrolase [Hymenobacter sp. RP-2-7]|uniref:HAD family hydrolase n=1 Tax=Hymenobacter polaris TaxID=2682546 RepID=A0A7Y0FLW0_9BACT|nr:HAD family hydrolase [Hymenobacter polaris]NML64831.1 HAD family hydrolase [Hymenobacter polaris]
MPEPILLILDLDETLIHATTRPLERPADFQVFQYHVYKRPGLDSFLRELAAHFQLAIWSSASDDYVREIAGHILPPSIPLAFVWGRSRCTPFLLPRADEQEYYDLYTSSSYEYAKRLKKVRRRGYDLRRVLIVDDTPAKVLHNYGNAIYPTPYAGQPNDQELSQLTAYLRSLSTAENVRTIEKRHWRSHWVP